MATGKGFIDFICDQVAAAGAIRQRKMFGEYMVYCDDKPALLVCDNTVFVKMLPEVGALFAAHGITPDVGEPYDGAKPHYILDCDNGNLAAETTRLLARILPPPKARKK
jgi:hypothetical protein